ncbi:MAG: glycosyltransferase [Verrucomicrobia bacterium]|nr:MAG: glycosyltransferase [Verrucomicrobiota bacterium]TAF25861.1 MAG: glycosyltransferase [Verrucomicrobiota bacterium]
MPESLMKIYTCALMPFEADAAFFARDSGLLCRALQALGGESRVVMPARDGMDPPDVIRANADEFIDPTWWKSLGIDGVVFIAWGFAEHSPVIQAARAAGIRTCALFDCNGDPFPYADHFAKPRILWRKGKFIGNAAARFVGTGARVVLLAIKGIRAHYQRSVQMGIPHVAAFQTPKTMERCLHVARLFPWVEVRSMPLVLGYAIPEIPAVSEFLERRPNVVAVARWDALRHKRPQVLIRVVEMVLRRHATVTFEVYGRLIPAIEQWHSQLDPELRARVSIQGVRPSREVMDSVGSSRILYCPSVEEGVPLPVVEALCAGCSVAGLGTPAVPGLYWAISQGDGTAAADDSIEAHAEAVLSELKAWEERRRDPSKISQYWRRWFSSPEVARRVVELMSEPSVRI